MEKLNWGIIGTGYIADRFAQNISEAKLPMLGVAARDFEKTKKFAQQYQIEKAYQGVDEMLSNDQIDAIYIATPNSTHFEYICESLNAGKHVLCEKPMVLNEEEFVEVEKLAQDKGLILEEAYTPLHMPLTKKLKEIVASEKFGAISMIQASFANRSNLNPKQRLLNPLMGGGALFDIGCYPMCFALQFMDEKEVQVNSQVMFAKTGVDVAETIQLSNGRQLANLSASFLNEMPKNGFISGEKGYIQVKHFSRADTAQLIYKDGTVEVIHAGDSEKAWLYEVQDFTKYVAQGHDDGELAFCHRLIRVMDRVKASWKK